MGACAWVVFNSLVLRMASACACECVCLLGGEVAQQDQLNGALAGKKVAVHHAADAQHGQAAVLDLLRLPRLDVRLGEACNARERSLREGWREKEPLRTGGGEREWSTMDRVTSRHEMLRSGKGGK